MTQAKPDIHAIFCGALDCKSPEELTKYLDEACGGDSVLRAEVEELLNSHRAAGKFLGGPSASRDVTLVPPVSEAPGTQIGPYKLLEQIGEGGFGIVYLSEQQHPVRRRVALKILKPGMDTRQVVARFEAERQALALMDHPHIAKVYDGGTTGSGRPFFVMELVNGVPITDYCDAHQLSLPERLELFVTVCQAVQHAHQKGIIHRDIKPSNVLVTQHDDRPVVKVIDFGVAKAAGGLLTDKTLFTGLAQMIGTPLYMSPEQAAMSGLDVDTRTDIYSLGVLLYELLTGTTPFDKDRLKSLAYDEICRIIREEEPHKPSTRLSELSRSGTASRTSGSDNALSQAGFSRRPGQTSLASISAVRKLEPHKLTRLLSGDLDWIVMKALEKDRTRRYATAVGLAADVQKYLAEEPVEARPPSALYRFRKFARRNKGVLAAAGASAAALVVAVVGLAVSNVLITGERDQKIRALEDKEAALQEKDEALADKEAALATATANFDEAKRQEGLAAANAEEARKQQQIAEEQEGLARRRFYAGQMNLAMQAWRAGDAPRVLELLEGQRPGPDDEDLRGFEWYHLWRLCNGAGRLHLPGHAGGYCAVRFSPDGKTIASGGWDRTVRIWDATTGAQVFRLLGHATAVWEVAFSPDGAMLASGGHNSKSLFVWDTQKGAPLYTIAESAAGLCFSPDGVILGGGGESSRFWEAGSGTLRSTFPESGVMVGFLADGRTVVTIANQFKPDSEIHLWNFETGERRLTMLRPNLRNGVLSPDRSRLTTVSKSSVEVWDTASGKVLHEFANEAGVPTLSPDGKTLACSTLGKAINLLDVETGQRLGLDPHLDPVTSIAFAPDSKRVASSSSGGAVKIWDMQPVEETITIQIGTPVETLRFASDGAQLVVGGKGPTTVVDVTTGKEISTMPVSGVTSISADGSTLAGPNGDEWIVWDAVSGREVARLPVPNDPNSSSRGKLSADGRLLATYYAFSDNPGLTLWDVASRQSRVLTGGPRRPSPFSIRCAAFSSDKTLVAAALGFQWFAVWEVATGRVKLQLAQEPSMMKVTSLAISPDNKALAVGTDVGSVTLWDVETGKRLAQFKGHTTTVAGLAFTPDGKTLATGGRDRTLRLWDVLTGQERASFASPNAQIGEVQFSPDGHTLATTVFGRSGTVELRRADTSLAALARRPHVEADDPYIPIVAEYNSFAWQLVVPRDPAERNPARAIELLEKALKLRPREARLWLTMGMARYRAGQWSEALAAFDQYDELWPRPVIGVFFRAMALWQLGDKDAARTCYETASARIDESAPHDMYLQQFRAEAAELLEMSPR